MTARYANLCSSITLEHFGPIVQSVVDELFTRGPRTLKLLQQNIRLPLIKLKESLCSLIKYGLVSYHRDERSIIYSLQQEKFIFILRYPRYMFFVKNVCGDESEIMMEEVLKKGYLTASQIIINAYKKIQQSSDAGSNIQPSVSSLKNNFDLIVKNQFFMRDLCTNLKSDCEEKPAFTLPQLNLSAIENIIKGVKDDPGDSKVYWKVNFDRLTQDFRDQVIVSAIRTRFDDNAGELMRQLLFLMYLRTASWADTSNPIPYTEIKDAVRKLEYPRLLQYLDQYLTLLAEDKCQFIRRVGDSGGGQYSISMKQAFYQLAWSTLENVVLERFGSDAVRIFRLIPTKKYIEQAQILQLAMMSEKKAKCLMFLLVSNNFIQLQELKKASSSAALAKVFLLYHVDLDRITRQVMRDCHHALYNVRQRREHEMIVNKRLIDKKLRVQTLSSNLKEAGATEEQLAEIEELMTPSEKQQLEKVQNVIKKLSATELHIDETLFVLTMYKRYHENPPKKIVNL
ncbi:PREDICTED: DNA-directed RNA polymerase III subunit RPC3 isoform X1 [Polistes canadensis]|uniref:DNA-directed RNA polymerase III subunit RPC3 isoform X1 n=1 Tax=Polistes canadensis TaxID=91411 RepID=UPI000718F4AD|nr:PREDICTED: DNA-directed RNA polymerase III subunit RPC3 isoform X1 [Polistes canadensis]